MRKAPFGRATLRDAEMQIDFTAVTSARDRVAVVATEPLTRDENWQQGTPGTMWVFDQGTLRATLPSGDGIDEMPRRRTPRRTALAHGPGARPDLSLPSAPASFPSGARLLDSRARPLPRSRARPPPGVATRGRSTRARAASLARSTARLIRVRAYSGAWAAINFETAAHAPEQAHARNGRTGKSERARPRVTRVAVLSRSGGGRR